jgi:Cof subfamily protein (haloacid dehalogenase superfamily)
MNNDNIKTLYVSDMDGTLLNSESRISSRTAATLNRLIRDYGAAFTVATARTPATTVPLMSGVNVKLPFVVLAGAALWNNTTEQYDDVCVIQPSDVATIAGIFERHGLHPFIYRRHGSMIYAYHCGEMSLQEKGFVAERIHLRLKKFFLDDADYCHNADDAMLIFSMNDYATLKSVCEEVKAQVKCSPMFYHDIFDNDTGLLEIYADGSSKAAAISRLAQRIGAGRIVVFGDNRNDIAMMQAATHSVAVDNAFPEVKAIADEIIGTNDDDSVVQWIENDLIKQYGVVHCVNNSKILV